MHVITSENAAEFYAKRLSLADVGEAAEKLEKALEKPDEPKPLDKKEEHDEDAPRGKRKPGIQDRFREMTESRRRAEERAEAAEKRAAELEAKMNPPKESAEGKKPVREDFSSDDEFNEAYTDWKVDQRLAKRDREEAEKKAKDQAEKVVRSFNKRRDELIESDLPDFEDVVGSATDLKVTDPVRDAILESDDGPRILYYLAENPDEVEKLNGLGIVAQVRMIGRLEAKLAKEAEKAQDADKEDKAIEKEEKPQAKAKPKPPAPISPIKSGSSGGDMDPDKMSFEQYKAFREAGKI